MIQLAAIEPIGTLVAIILKINLNFYRSLRPESGD